MNKEALTFFKKNMSKSDAKGICKLLQKSHKYSYPFIRKSKNGYAVFYTY